MDRDGTKNAFSSLDAVTDLVFAAYVEKPTMAETVEPNASMLTNALDALTAGNVPVQRVVLAGSAKSYGFSLGASSDVLLCTDLSKSSAEGPLVSLMCTQEDQ
jgi:nucleoside-diphosphate-sugar epimerase